jgi:proteic killer suppression protein
MDARHVGFRQRFTAARRCAWIESRRPVELDDLRVPPSHRLELLKGDRAGRYSIRINDPWRVCFDWRDGNAYDVEIVDYH